MTIGQNFLLKILQSNSSALLVSLDANDFQTEFERPVYDFIVTYYRKHSALPPLDVVRAKFKLDVPMDGEIGFWYDEFLKRKFLIRYDGFINATNQVLSKGDMEAALERVQAMALDLSNIGVTESPVISKQDMLSLTLSKFRERSLVGGNVGVLTPWNNLNNMFHGFTQSNLYVIAGRKKAGKSQVLILCADNSFNTGYDTLTISMEMHTEEYANRVVSISEKIGLNHIITGRLSTMLERQIRWKARVKTEVNYYYREGYFNSSTAQIEHLINMLQPKIVFIDGAYLVRPVDVNKGMAGWERVTQTVKELKMIAGRHRIPIVCTYQFNQEGEVHLSDAIAQIATTVFGVYKIEQEPLTRVIRIKDNRNGTDGEIKIAFDFDRVDFQELSHSSEVNMEQFLTEEQDVGD